MYWFDQTNYIFEKFLINADDEIDFTNTSLLSEFIELHGTIAKSRIIIRISYFKLDRFTWVVNRSESIYSFRRRTISTQVPIESIDIIKLKTSHLPSIKFYNKGRARKSSASTELITILVEEEDACWSFFTENSVPCVSIFLDIYPKILRQCYIHTTL